MNWSISEIWYSIQSSHLRSTEWEEIRPFPKILCYRCTLHAHNKFDICWELGDSRGRWILNNVCSYLTTLRHFNSCPSFILVKLSWTKDICLQSSLHCQRGKRCWETCRTGCHFSAWIIVISLTSYLFHIYCD